MYRVLLFGIQTLLVLLPLATPLCGRRPARLDRCMDLVLLVRYQRGRTGPLRRRPRLQSFRVKPLCVVAMTRPVTVLNSTLYRIIKSRLNIPPLCGWVSVSSCASFSRPSTANQLAYQSAHTFKGSHLLHTSLLIRLSSSLHRCTAQWMRHNQLTKNCEYVYSQFDVYMISRQFNASPLLQRKRLILAFPVLSDKSIMQIGCTSVLFSPLDDSPRIMISVLGISASIYRDHIDGAPEANRSRQSNTLTQGDLCLGLLTGSSLAAG